MADAKVQIGLSTEFLEGTSVDTPAGEGLFREGVVLSDPEVAQARARILNTTPGANDYGAVVRVAGAVALDSASLIALENITVNVEAGASVGVNNFPATYPLPQAQVDAIKPLATQPVSGTVAVNNFPATQAVSGTVTANLGTLNGAATAANQATGNTSLASIDGKLPDESGTWGYNAGTSGTLNVAANKRILAITATAPALTAASLTINAGQSITVPAGTSITISPRANLTAPSLVFTGTAAYFVEFIE